MSVIEAGDQKIEKLEDEIKRLGNLLQKKDDYINQLNENLLLTAQENEKLRRLQTRSERAKAEAIYRKRIARENFKAEIDGLERTIKAERGLTYKAEACVTWLKEAVELLGNHAPNCQCSCMDFKGIAERALRLTKEQYEKN